MIDLGSWPVMIKLILLMIPAFMVLIGMAIVWLVASTRLFFVMCEAFKNSPGLNEDRRLWGTLTLMSRSLIVCGVSVGMIWPALGVRQGWLSVADYIAAPAYLRRGLQISFWCNTAGAALLVVTYYLFAR